MKRLVDIAALAAIVLAIVAARVVWSSRGEWRAATAAQGDEQLVHLGRAARLYAPGNPYSRRAFAQLAQIGRDEPTRALAAWRELRSLLDRAIDRKLGPGRPARDPGDLAALGPAQKRLRALLWKHGAAEFAEPGLNPVELVDRLSERLKRQGAIKEDGGE